MAEKRLIGRDKQEIEEVFVNVLKEYKGLIGLNDKEMIARIEDRPTTFSCVKITNMANADLIGYAILSGGERKEITNMRPGESQVIGQFEYIDIAFQTLIVDPPVKAQNLSSVMYVEVIKTKPGDGTTKKEQILFSVGMYPTVWTYTLNNTPKGREHLILLPFGPRGRTIEQIKSAVDNAEDFLKAALSEEDDGKSV